MQNNRCVSQCRSLTLSHLLSVMGLMLLSSQVVLAESLQGPKFSATDHVESISEEWEGTLIDRSQWQPVDGEPIDLAVTLDQHLYPALKPLIGDFARENGLRIAVQEGTCGISAGKLMDKEVDIGGFCCPAGEVDRLPGLRYHTLGVAPLALLVNPANSVSDISLKQARDIFQGRIRYWKQLEQGQEGGHRMVIEPVVRLHCKNRPGHWRLLLGHEDLFGINVYEVSTIPDMIHRVASQRGVIGYETMWMTERYRDEGEVKAIAINGVKPTDEASVVKGRYPLYRTYNISTWSGDHTRNPQAEALADYLIANFETVDKRYGIIPHTLLRQHGWKFSGSEMTGEPDQSAR